MTLSQLGIIVQNGFGLMEKGFSAIQIDLANIYQTMATKEDIRALRAEIYRDFSTKEELAERLRRVQN